MVLLIASKLPLGAQTTNTDGYTPTAMEPGSPAGSYHLSNIDDISLYTGKANIRIPLLQVGGRGKAGYTMLLPLQRLWRRETFVSGSPAITQYAALPPDGPNMVLWGNVPLFSPGALYERTAVGPLSTCQGCASNFYATTVSRLTFVRADGTETDLVDTSSGGDILDDTYDTPASRGTTFVSRDGTFMRFTSDSPVIDSHFEHSVSQPVSVSGNLVTSDGTTYRIDHSQVSWIRDANGNQTFFSYLVAGINTGVSSITDSDGRVTSISYSASEDVITYPGANGQNRTVTLHIGPLDSALDSGQGIQTFGQLFSFVDFGQGGTFDPQVFTSIVLPDVSQYTIKYNSYSEVTTVALPTSGTIQFSYAQGPISTSGSINRYVTERKTFDGGGLASDTLYNYSGVTNPQTNTMTTVLHLLNGADVEQETHLFYGNGFYENPAPYGFQNWLNGREYETDYLMANGPNSTTPLKTVVKTWAQRPCQSGEVCLSHQYATMDGKSPDQYDRENYPNDPQVTQTLVTLADTNQQAATAYQYDRYNNVTDQKEFDWGAGATSSTVNRETKTMYLTDPGYLGNNLIALPVDVQVLDGAGTLTSDTQYSYDGTPVSNCPNIVGHDNQNFAGGGIARGNVTGVKRWLNTNSGTPLATQMDYDIAGNLVASTDANGHSTFYSYVDSYADGMAYNSYAHVTAQTNALNQTARWVYDYGTGKPVQAVDINGLTTGYSYNDPLDRLVSITQPNGGTVTYAYTGTQQVDTYRDQTAAGDHVLHAATLYDGLGRVIEQRTYESGNYISTTTAYDGLGRVSTTTNPSRPNDGLNFATTYGYDALDRVTSVMTADGATTTTSYTGNRTTVTDAAGHVRQTTTNSLGWLTAVLEDPGGLNYLTTYGYDANGNLTSVNQSGQTRTFVYDSLSRLTKATNPESGTVQYGYDNIGNLTNKIDPRLVSGSANITTTTTYDALNRIMLETYNDGTPTVTYTYDSGTVANGLGHLASVANGYSTTNFTGYDAMGRVVGSSQATDGKTFSFAYSYNLAGDLVSETYPSGRVLTTGFDAANRAHSLSGTLGSTATPYVTAIGYAPQGAVGALSYGNQVVSIWNYDQQLRPSTYWDTLNNLGNQFLRSVSLGWYGNGNLAGMTTQAGGPGVLSALPSFAQTFQYDNVNRLTVASETNGWSQAYRYDAFGNLLQWGDVNNPQTNAFVNNQVNVTPMPSPYDKAGNQTMIDGDLFTYDALNRQATVTEPEPMNGSASYLYDGQGQRVETIANGIPTVYVYDALGKLAAEYAVGNQPAAPCQTCYLSWDHLGTPRMVTDSSGTVVARHDYYPFGGEITVGTGARTNIWDASDTIRQKFTGKERDETGLDYFGARYYGSALGRFTSPDKVGDGLDPAPVPWANFENPQSLNLYAYVRNSPLSNSDPDGNDCVVQTRTDYDKETVTVSSGNCDNVNVENGQTKKYIAGTVDVSSIESNGSGGITFGYTPYQGGGGVADLQGASIPDNPNLAYDWQNNAHGYQTLRTTAATVGSVKGVALFYVASTATAACALFCPEAAAALDVAQNQLALKAMAYLESHGIPATKAAELVAKMGATAGRAGLGTALGQAWRQLAPKLNEAVRDYRQSQSNAH